MPSSASIKFRLPLAVSALWLVACAPKSDAPPQTSAPPSSETAAADGARRDASELKRIESLVRAGAARAGVYASPSDAELKAQYQRLVAGFPLDEFHVALILVPTERMAKGLISELQSGAEFAKLAREESTDKSNVEGGDIGWIAPGKLPAEWRRAVQGLKPGQVSPFAVHTSEGWHVIKLLEARSSAAPPFDAVKAQLIVAIQQQRYEEFLAGSLARTADQ